MKKHLVSIAITTALLAGAANIAHADDQQTSGNRHKQYIGTGIGAAAGAVVAGPVGLVVGGLIGNLAARHDAKSASGTEQAIAANEPQSPVTTQSDPAAVTENTSTETIVVAQAAEAKPVINDDLVDHNSDLKDLLVEDLSLDVFFLSGSTTVESYYRPRLQTVAKIMQQFPDMEIHLEGYSDRRGDKDTNLALSNQRLDAVCNELVQAGIDADRIHMSAFGEMQFVSTPGDLEAYTFDRRVVIRFQHSPETPRNPIASIENSTAL